MIKKRVCIVTNYSNTTNYGALLQAYALNRIINEMGYPAEDLYYIQKSHDKRKKIKQQIIEGDFKSIINQIRSRVERIRVLQQLSERKTIMDNFRLSIPHTRLYDTESLKTVCREYDVFISGSDQIFRPNRNSGKLEEHYWLSMVDSSCVKASYAASIGIGGYDKGTELIAAEYLKSFDYISLREEEATDYIKQITGREDITTSVDPVFLLGRDDWLQIAKPYEINCKYVLVYMIHGTRELYKSIKDFSVRNNLKIINFPSMSYKFKDYEKGFGDINISNASPNQFIYLIENATYFFTDSFHGTAFSIILHKSAFISKANEVAFSRINHIVNLFGVENLIIPSNGKIEEKPLVEKKIDWSCVDRLIDKERENSLRYLRSVIEG